MAHVTTIRNEPKRGCGFRKPGGLYLMAGEASAPCGKLPFPLETCPCCGGGIKPSRGWTWINPRALMGEKGCALEADPETRNLCASCVNRFPPERAGLLWIGEAFYPTPQDFIREARELGISRRISAVPRDFIVGETWVYFAHRKSNLEVRPCETCATAVALPGGPVCEDCGGTGKVERWIPAIIGTFRPTKIEYIVKGTETEEELDRLEARGLTLVKLERSTDESGNHLLLEDQREAAAV